jgi:hypothetical protein
MNGHCGTRSGAIKVVTRSISGVSDALRRKEGIDGDTRD